jgi:stage V sporulation protein G
MLITEMQIRRTENTGTKMKGVATVILDNMIVMRDIKVLLGEDRYFLAMPNRAVKDGHFKDIVPPINAQVRKIFENLIIGGYEKMESEGYLKAQFILTQSGKTSLLDQTLEDFSIDAKNSAVYNEQKQAAVETAASEKHIIDDDLLKWLES